MNCRDQILSHRLGRAFRTMKSLPSFQDELQTFVQEEARLQAQGILEDKDDPRASFSLADMTEFSYKEQLRKFQRTNPILVASILGTLSRHKGDQAETISRKGFGGAKRGEDIDLVPTVVQTVSRVLKNRHPSSISLLPCLNSLYLWGNRVPGHLFHFYNSYRCDSVLFRGSLFMRS